MLDGVGCVARGVKAERAILRSRRTELAEERGVEIERLLESSAVADALAGLPHGVGGLGAVAGG
jgi:hypothetical protein